MKDACKRAIDCAVAFVALLAFAPLILIVAFLVWADLGRPLLFRQVRVGRGGALFRIVKFRTMRDIRDASGRLLPDRERVSGVGGLLRRFRLDELPELVAVLTGRLSLVGPRPLPPRILAGLPGAAERTTMRPGLTGLAQVSGNALLTNPEKVAVDLYYIRHWTIPMDLAILARTVVMLVAGQKRDEALIGRTLADLGAGDGPQPPSQGAPPRPEARLR